MHFSRQEIALAQYLRHLGLPWQPQVGHFVWDATRVIEIDSPFQAGVYFILDLKHFLRRVGSLAALQAAMIWLPTWHDARAILQDLGVSGQVIADTLQATAALQHGSELVTLYQLIATQLQQPPSAAHAPPRPA
jgi:hypothetical protein